MKYKLLLLDIDGTLRPGSCERVPKENAEAVCAVQKAGVKIAIATGRGRIGVGKGLLRSIRPDYWVCAGGAQLVDYKGCDLALHRLTSEEMYALVDFFEDHELPLRFTFHDANYAYLGYEEFARREREKNLALNIVDGEDQDQHLQEMPFGAFGFLSQEMADRFQEKYGYLGLKFLFSYPGGDGCDILQQGIDKGNQRKDGEQGEHDNAQGIVGTEKRRGAEVSIVQVLVPAERDKDCRHKGCHLPDKADDKVGGNADEQPLLGKLRRKGAGQIHMQQRPGNADHKNQKHQGIGPEILGPEGAEVDCIVGQYRGSSAERNKQLAEQCPDRAADNLGGNMFPRLHRQRQHQIATVAQQTIKLPYLHKEAEHKHHQQANEGCKSQQHHTKADQRQAISSVLNKMGQNSGKQVQHQHARRNGQDNTAGRPKLIM